MVEVDFSLGWWQCAGAGCTPQEAWHYDGQAIKSVNQYCLSVEQYHFKGWCAGAGAPSTVMT